jgi:hypothetical protein
VSKSSDKPPEQLAADDAGAALFADVRTAIALLDQEGLGTRGAKARGILRLAAEAYQRAVGA